MNLSNNISGRVATGQFYQKLAAGRPEDIEDLKVAATDFTRLTVSEEGLLRRVIPPQPITVAECDKQLDTDKPVKLVEREVNQPLSASVPFGTLPRNFYIRGRRYRIEFARIMSRNYVADVKQLESYGYDIQNVFKERAIRDMCYGEDIPFFSTLNSIVEPASPQSGGNWSTGEATMVSPFTGKVQKYDFTNAGRNPFSAAVGFTRESFVESFKIMTKGFTPSGFSDDGGPNDDQTPIRLITKTCLMNVNTGLEFAKFKFEEFGGPGAESMLKDGVTEANWMGRRFIFTIKDDIVKDGEMYMFSDPEFLGKFYEMDAPTMFIDTHAFLVEFFVYSCVGAGIGNPFGVAKVKFF